VTWMIQIPDDPIIACMERTGYPPWIHDPIDNYFDESEEDEYEDSFDDPETIWRTE